jgi:hypothetical protein
MWDTVNHGPLNVTDSQQCPQSVAVDLRTRHVHQLKLASSHFLRVDLGAYYC